VVLIFINNPQCRSYIAS